MTEAMNTPALLSCPYKGLQPYTEADRAYFFGRERDRQIIISNLYAAPLTILYGASGVGKSSVLLAGVAPELRATPRVALIVFREWQDQRFDRALKQAVVDEVARKIGKEASVDLDLPFDEFLAQCLRTLRGDIFFILDQFEEYFLYHSASTTEESFDAQFARAVNRPEVRANFLLSIREDGLSKLDRFQGRIPNLLANMLRLEHLDRASAEDAIRKPLEQYNRSLPDDQKIHLEEGKDGQKGLVEVLLDQVTTGKVTLDQTGQGQVGTESSRALGQGRIETPFLQMVLTRLWEEEIAAGSRELRLATLIRLGGTENIARTHLDKEMTQLSGAEREIAARLFRFLVTPSGTKIAQEPGALAVWAWPDVSEPQAEQAIEQTKAVLTRLSAGVRILRCISAPSQPDRYEIFHDVLAPAILDWRRRYVEQQEQERIKQEAQQEQERIRREDMKRREQEQAEEERKRQLQEAHRLRRTVGVLALMVLAMGASLLFAFWSRSAAVKAQIEENKARLQAEQNLKMAQEEKGKAEQAEDLRQATVTSANALVRQVEPHAPMAADVKPRIYFHYQVASQKAPLDKLKDQLKSDFAIPPAQLVDQGPSRSQLRYFRESEKDLAVKAYEILRNSIPDLQLLYIKGFETSTAMRQNHYELWLSPDALKAPPAVPQARP